VILIGTPNTKGNKFMIKSAGFNVKDIIEYLKGNENYKPYEAYFTVDFWACEAGEEFGRGTCSICDTGFYSLKPGEALCIPCMDHVNCTGGNKLVLEEGYWRDTLMRDEVLECYWKESCLGGYYPDQEYPVKCAEGY